MIEVKSTYEYQSGTIRTRSLERWNIVPESMGFVLTGFVIMEESSGERPLSAGATHRFTTTSLIKSVSGRTVKTISGSTYQLVGDPSPAFLDKLIKSGLLYHEESPLSIPPFTNGT